MSKGNKIPVFFDIAPTKMAKEVYKDKLPEKSKHYTVPSVSRHLIKEEEAVQGNPLLVEGESSDPDVKQAKCKQAWCPCNAMLLIPIFLGVLIVATIAYKYGANK